MTNRFGIAALIFLLAAFSLDASAQDAGSVRSEAMSILRELAPPDDKDHTYKIDVPGEPAPVPKSVKLDLVYKIGHYAFEYVAVRFERSAGEKDVTVTYFSHGNALDFYKKYSDGEKSIAMTGTIPAEEFDRMLKLALTLYNADIRKIPRKDAARNGVAGSTYTYSSGDGSIAIKLADEKSAKPLINESGTLISGELRTRASDGHKGLRVHLFWNVFFERLEQNGFMRPLDTYTAEAIAIDRLSGPPVISDYTDFYRQALFVEHLGHYGTERSLPVLEKLRQNNGLEDGWSDSIKRRAGEVIISINQR